MLEDRLDTFCVNRFQLGAETSAQVPCDMAVLAVGYSDSQAMVFSALLRRLGDDVSMTPPAGFFPNSTPETPR